MWITNFIRCTGIAVMLVSFIPSLLFAQAGPWQGAAQGLESTTRNMMIYMQMQQQDEQAKQQLELQRQRIELERQRIELERRKVESE